jgi:hypothetical protein
LFLSAAGDRTHIGTYVGVSPPPASNENNLKKFHKRNFVEFFIFDGKFSRAELSTVLLENYCFMF